jgi:hypothetical protein
MSGKETRSRIASRLKSDNCRNLESSGGCKRSPLPVKNWSVREISTSWRLTWAGGRYGCLNARDLATSRTPNEFANEVNSLVRGSQNERPTVVKHAARAKWVADHVAGVLQQFRISDVRRWRIRACIVLDTELITKFLTEPSIPLLTLPELLRVVTGGKAATSFRSSEHCAKFGLPSLSALRSAEHINVHD